MMLPKRSEIKAKYRLERSESPMEQILKEEMLSVGLRSFKQQFNIKGFFVDFAVPELSLVIEYDGEIHIGDELKDYEREKVIRNEGWKVLRIKNWGNYWEITLDGEELGIFLKIENAINCFRNFIKDKVLYQRISNSDWLIKQASEQNLEKGFESFSDIAKRIYEFKK